jgi:hypothetical protein
MDPVKEWNCIRCGEFRKETEKQTISAFGLCDMCNAIVIDAVNLYVL